MKSLLYILFEKYIYILSLEVASPGNQHRAFYIGTPLFFIASPLVVESAKQRSGVFPSICLSVP